MPLAVSKWKFPVHILIYSSRILKIATIHVYTKSFEDVTEIIRLILSISLHKYEYILTYIAYKSGFMQLRMI